MATLSGKIIDKHTGQPVPDLRIELWDFHGRVNKPIARFRTGAQGNFKSIIREEYLTRRFGRLRPAKVYFKIFKGEKLLLSTKETLVWDLADNLTDIEIVVDIYEPEDQHYFVSGTIRLADGTPLPNVKVVAFDTDIRREEKEVKLGKSTTDENGRYEIEYSKDKFQLIPTVTRLKKESPDVIVKVFKDHDTKPLVSSSIKINAGPKETIDLTVPQDAYRGRSEYEKLVTRIETFLGGRPVTELKEDDERQDVTFVARKTNSDPQRIKSLIKAKKLAKGTNIAPEFFFALARHGMPIDNVQKVVAHRLPAIRRTLEAAIDDNTLPENLRADVDSVVDRLKALAVEFVLRPETEPDRVSIGALLATSRLDRPAQERLVAVAWEQEDGAEDFWSRLAKTTEFRDENKTRMKEAQVTLQLGALTGYHVPLVQALQDELHEEERLRDLEHLASLEDERWEAIVRRSGVPEEVTGEDEDDRIKKYVNALQGQVEAAFPTATIAARLDGSDLPHAGAVKAFLNDNPEFDLLTDSVERTVGAELTEPVRGELKRIQRLARVTPHFKEIDALLAAGVDSAQKMTAMSEGAFVARFGTVFENVESARTRYRIAAQRRWLATHLRMRHAREFDYGRPSVVPPAFIEAQADETRLDLTTLFGSPDVCECEHCQSVRGPASYLVDLLQFIDCETDRVLQVQLNKKPPASIASLSHR